MAKHTHRNVTIDTRTVGGNFGTCGIVRDARTRRKLAESDTTRPLGFTDAAMRDAENIATAKGWTVVTDAAE